MQCWRNNKLARTSFGAFDRHLQHDYSFQTDVRDLKRRMSDRFDFEMKFYIEEKTCCLRPERFQRTDKMFVEKRLEFSGTETNILFFSGNFQEVIRKLWICGNFRCPWRFFTFRSPQSKKRLKNTAIFYLSCRSKFCHVSNYNCHLLFSTNKKGLTPV